MGEVVEVCSQRIIDEKCIEDCIVAKSRCWRQDIIVIYTG